MRRLRSSTAVSKVLALAPLALAVAAAPSARAEGTWTQAPSSTVNGGPAFGLWLLTDGRVLSHGSALNHWVILTPDAKGSYADGTWKSVASSAYARGGAQEHILKDGRFFEAGGEYIYVYPGCASSCTQPANGSPLFKNVEIYDPVADSWTVEASGLLDIGDTGSATLSDGRIFDSTRASAASQIYDPSTNTWTQGPNSPVGSGDENAWASLQNGGVLAVAPHGAAIYDPAANKWTATGPLPSGLAVTLPQYGSIQFGDVAGISQMFDGRVLAYGLGTTAIYTPGATASDPGTWALGPNMLTGSVTTVEPGNEAEDEYTVTEPNGKVMVATYPYQGSPNLLQEYDPTANTMTAITPPPDASGPYPVSYLNLPNGQVMVTCGSRDWLYTPDGAPQDAWRPTVTSVTFDGNATYTLTGTQISGLINGGDEGDDMTMAENYPIVWLKDGSGNVYFCKSSDFSNMMPSAGSTPETCQFTTPANLPAGTYSLYVSAVGVMSKDPFPFTVGVGGTDDGGTPTGGSSSSGAMDASAPDASGPATADAGGSSAVAPSADSSSARASGSNAVASNGSGSSASNGASSSRGASSASDQSEGGPGVSGSKGCGCRVAGHGSRDPGAAFGAGAFAMLAGLRLRRRRRASR